MFWLELLIVSVLANVFWAGLFCLIKIRLSHNKFPNPHKPLLPRKARLKLIGEIDDYRYGLSDREKLFSVVSAGILIFPFIFISRLPSATAAAWREFWQEILE